eukprot:snap_masked-scaffold_28-processed-gene-0.4-mRNA-1 protein AED:1.00 eAED:1.00 QI:0/0/0/0/1/1/2/0/67
MCHATLDSVPGLASAKVNIINLRELASVEVKAPASHYDFLVHQEVGIGLAKNYRKFIDNFNKKGKGF